MQPDDEKRIAADDASGLRPLTEREREILDFLLSVEMPGVEALREQASVAQAKPWDCGCASIDLVVDQERAPQSSIAVRPAIEANSKDRDEPHRIFDLLVWVDDGWLSGVELVEYGFDRHADAPDVFPPPTDFEPAFAYRHGEV